MERALESDGRTTTQEYWDDVHGTPIRHRLPSRLIVPTRNVLRLLAPHAQAGSRVLEIGFAPGKILLWLAVRRKALVTGLDYSAPGVQAGERLFRACGVQAELRCEDLATTSLPPRSFDLVYSLGLIEHFEDPTEMIHRHLGLVRPGGVAVMAIPNYGGIYGKLQRHFDPDNLRIHNLDLMSEAALRRVMQGEPSVASRSMAFGRGHLALVNLDRRIPRAVARALTLAANALGVVQPFDIRWLCPLLVLEVRKH